MSCFRINLYLTIKNFILSFFITNKKMDSLIINHLKLISKKKETLLTSQLRVGFILILKYLKKKYPKKNQIILNSYNLAEMVNICTNLGFKIVFTKLNKNLFIDKEDLNKRINKYTLAVVATNIFNTYNDIKNIKHTCHKKNILLIEDNAIYYGNYKNVSGKKIFSGSFGDYSLNSFNIMKNISAMYGGAVCTDDKNFIKFANKELLTYNNFPLLIYLKQCFTFLILKFLKLNIIYKFFFFNLIKFASKKNIKFILSLVYPSIRFKKQYFPKYYFTKIHELSKKMIYLQIKDKENFDKNHKKKKYNNILYHKTFTRLSIPGVELVNYEDSNFQNFNDFPIIVKHKGKLVNYLFSKGIETKSIQYVDCQKIFYNKKKCKKLSEYQDRVLCLPNHKEINKHYINYIVSCLANFYEIQTKVK